MISAASRPQLAAKARLRRDRRTDRLMILYPEKGIELSPTAAEIVRLCTGENTVSEIVADQRFAAGKVELHHPEGFGLPEHPQPVRRAELVAVACEVERVRAVHAAQRTAVGQLRHQGVRPRSAVAHGSVRMSARSTIA